MKTTYYGHACFAVQIKNRTLLFDPFITPNELAKNIDVNKVPADYILITHAHDDHMADARNITLEELAEAAIANDMHAGQTIDNIKDALEHITPDMLQEAIDQEKAKTPGGTTTQTTTSETTQTT